MGGGTGTGIYEIEVIDQYGIKRRLEHYSHFREGDSLNLASVLLILSASGTEFACAARKKPNEIVVRRIRFWIPDNLEFASMRHPSEVIGTVTYTPDSKLGKADRMRYRELATQLAEAEARWQSN